MKYTLFAGCSYTAGTGFLQEKHDSALWVNILFNSSKQLKQTQLLNVAEPGRSNQGIFADAVYNLTTRPCKYAIVEWTNSPRYEVELGLELYETKQVFIPNSPTRTHNLNDRTYSSTYLDKVRDRFTSLAHLHYEIKNLVHYVNSLTSLAKLTKTKIFFVNGLCQWDVDYFDKMEHVLPNSYTKFTKKLLNIENRDDTEIVALYEKIHNQYQQLGGIQPNHWLNLYQSMRHLRIDTNSDHVHPGSLSNQNYATQFLSVIEHQL